MSEVLARRFAAIGARLKLDGPPLGSPTIDVGVDARGEFFAIRFSGSGGAVALEVVDVDRQDRHLLLLARNAGEKSKFLCGHDERHWFVAAVPESARGVTGVRTAKVALQPALVRAAIDRRRPKNQFRRRNDAYVRQGEWFFVPVPELDPPEALVLRDEPLMRNRGKAHMLEFAYRHGGENLRQQRFGRWVHIVRDPQLYATGTVRHPDHATVLLRGWYRVLMNTEQGARAMRHVQFLD
jgi:hypothetical protein